MNFKKSALASAITLATFATGAAAFDASSWEVSGFVKNETAALQGSGTFIGQATKRTDTTSHNDSGDVIKFENTAKVFVNGDLTENAALHAELNFVYDTEATPNDYQGHMNYSQQDYLRELYVDTMVGDTEVRVGKQQVVWGTADGIKLLDIINPTDYREFAQNTMEDSRIPVWMIKTDTYVGDTGSLQFIVSQVDENKIAGLNASGDQGNPYIMKGVDTITGKVNGFYNLAPAMGNVAKFFVNAAGGRGAAGLGGFGGATVKDFVDGSGRVLNFYNLCNATSNITGAGSGPNAACLSGIANDTATISGTTYFDGLTPGSNDENTNLIQSTNAEFSVTAPDTVFEYMSDATFATFATFASASSGLSTSYKKDYPSDASANAGFRFKDSLDNGLNYSANYFYHYDSNPMVDIDWVNSSGAKYRTAYANSLADGTIYAGCGSAGSAACTVERTTVTLVNSSGSNINATSEVPTLQFTEKLNRIHSLGGSFDYTVDAEAAPVVLRGEFLYDKDVMTPIIDRAKLSIGDLTGALTNQKADFFKYVIGADINVLTNMLVSGQFIQFRNLDYVDEASTPTALNVAGTATVTSTTSGRKYTGDMATLHMSNDLQKARENKEFYSLFLSKPFGANQLGRWNNIFMFEEGGGKWNRFDVEYSFSDELVGSFELNNYWGDANTQFGQMEDSSNIQVGLKYLF